MKIYLVFHDYDIDGNDDFCEVISQSEFIEAFEERADAEEFVQRFAHPQIYGIYSNLECGHLCIEEIEIISHKEFQNKEFDTDRYWWLEDEL